MSRHSSPAPDDQPLEWRTIEEAAALCRRTVGTIKNLVSKHQLPARRAWEVRNRQRRRITLLAPGTVAKLQKLTLFAPTRKERTTSTTSPPSHDEASDP